MTPDTEPDGGDDRRPEPIPGLDRLAAEVDLDAAVSAFRRVRARRSRQRRSLGGVCAVIALAGVIAAASTSGVFDGSGTERVRAGENEGYVAPPPGVPRYWTRATVAETAGQEPSLCLGASTATGPPRCDDVPIVNWEWARVEGEQRSGGSTWGEYEVVGTYDGEVFTLTEAPRAPDPTDDPALLHPRDEVDPEHVATPCPEPEAGWPVAAPADRTVAARQRFEEAVGQLPDVAGVWYGVDAETEGAGTGVYTVAFTRDAAGHEAEVRALWSGAVCVVEADRTAEQLDRVLASLAEDAEELGLLTVDVVDGEDVVRLEVVRVDDRLRRELDDRYGAGTVVVTGALQELAP